LWSPSLLNQFNGDMHLGKSTVTEWHSLWHFFTLKVCQTKTMNCKVKWTIQLCAYALPLTISLKKHLLEEKRRCQVW
jgi:hypothetical protein